jgi:hypothetical protein
VYIGKYLKGKPNGDGQYLWANGSSYVGEFRMGTKYGKGHWRKSKDAVTNSYDGEYIEDKKNGLGEFRWESGNVYNGEYYNDE